MIPPAVSVTKWGLVGSELLRSNWDQGDFTLRWLTPPSSLSLLISHLSSFLEGFGTLLCVCVRGADWDHQGGCCEYDNLIHGLEDYDRGPLYHIIYIIEWRPNLIWRYHMIAGNYL